MNKKIITAVTATLTAYAFSANTEEDMFFRMDVNGDGKVILQEYVDLFIPHFDIKNTNRDEFLSLEEFSSSPTAFNLADEDGDGRLSREEYRNLYVMQFKKRDANGDGILVLDEMTKIKTVG